MSRSLNRAGTSAVFLAGFLAGMATSGVGLKVTGQWGASSWWVVLAPLWGPVVIAAGGTVLACAALLVGVAVSHLRSKRERKVK